MNTERVKRFFTALAVMAAGFAAIFALSSLLYFGNEWLAGALGLPDYWSMVFYFAEIAVAVSAWYAVTSDRAYT